MGTRSHAAHVAWCSWIDPTQPPLDQTPGLGKATSDGGEIIDMAPASWGKKMNNKFGLMEAPDWWSKELGTWAKNQRKYGKAFKKPASQRSEAEKANASKTTKRRVALLDGIGFFT